MSIAAKYQVETVIKWCKIHKQITNLKMTS